MSETATFHIEVAEHLLRQAQAAMDKAQSQHDWRRVEFTIQMAQAHAQIANAKRWAKPS